MGSNPALKGRGGPAASAGRVPESAAKRAGLALAGHPCSTQAAASVRYHPAGCVTVLQFGSIGAGKRVFCRRAETCRRLHD